MVFCVLFAGLAVSDFLFCFITLFCTYLSKDDMVYKERNPILFFTVYGPYFQNLFIKTSIAVTVIMAIYRHFCVHCPIWSRQKLTNIHTLMAIGASFLFWILFLLPLLWTFKVKTLHCTETSTAIILIPKLEQNPSLRKGTSV